LARVNTVTIFMWLLMPLTFPEPRAWGFSISGAQAALLFTCKLNLISVVLIRMVAALGLGGLDNVLGSLRLPEMLRVLLLLTGRYILLLLERVTTMTLAIRLRAPNLRGRRLCSTFACMLGTTLIHSSDRAERAMLAMKLRSAAPMSIAPIGAAPTGGTHVTLAGFAQGNPLLWRRRDGALCAFFAVNILVIACVCFFV